MDEELKRIEERLRNTADLAIDPLFFKETQERIFELYQSFWKRRRALVSYEGMSVELDFFDCVQREDGIIAYRYILSRGWLVVVIKQIYNYKLAISKHSKCFYDDMWCFERGVDAILGVWLNGWEYGDEPLGWYRHPASGRRREHHDDGTLKKEWIQL